ncbi:4 -phosphopantetheinyl transferase [Grosmannia clavigera kw1407]|uniref:holo-[acyl-carrier-protein] synthase n=1 Tax=Grosmannia clavigera (strain kw1407 / UAMH 11150) TaxID=655863 RepID=F0XJ21_GROCL|nr:4 -phosphopantetheinyl transferase [Grosmannia clavigera kw1407]EFX02129.1 4 -phosphopantetheinyl transferase [Grosmannia clavigera kw1407]
MDVLSASPDQPVLVQWLLDTRSLWPEATQTQQLKTVASRALGVLLTDADRTSVLRYFHVRDAKMALASLLLKHLIVARCAGVCWERTRLTRNAHSKPVYRVPEGGTQPVAFNVSHQAGLVMLAAVYGGEKRHGVDVGGFFDVGVDVVSPGERRGRDHQTIDAEGWGSFVDMHADVFATGEAECLKHEVLSVVSSSSLSSSLMLSPNMDLVDLKLRCFYTLWCLREAYVKMTGEALLAPWLGELEFRRFRPPPPVQSPPSDTTDLRQDAAAAVTTHDIRLRGHAVNDVNMCLQALGDDFMACTAIRTPAEPAAAMGLVIGPFEVLDLQDMLDFAERFREGKM